VTGRLPGLGVHSRRRGCTLTALDAHSTCFAARDSGDPDWVNQPKEPQDARESTEEQRRQQEQLEHQHDDPDAPGLQQSARNVPDESTR
jgi:hypothetical protein